MVFSWLSFLVIDGVPEQDGVIVVRARTANAASMRVGGVRPGDGADPVNAPARPGVKTRGPYAVVRHPIYASYLLIQSGYLLQSVSVRNVLVLALASGCNIGRALAEERLLARSAAYRAYRQKVRWRLIPGLW